MNESENLPEEEVGDSQLSSQIVEEEEPEEMVYDDDDIELV